MERAGDSTLCQEEADEETVYFARDAALAEPEFRAKLDTMERPRRAVLHDAGFREALVCLLRVFGSS